MLIKHGPKHAPFCLVVTDLTENLSYDLRQTE